MEEYNEENEFEDFDNSEDIKELSERMRIAMIEKSVDMNYKRMMSNGFSIKNIKTFTDAEKKEVIETLQYMINFYEEEEMYEHCGNLLKMANAFTNIEDFKPIIL